MCVNFPPLDIIIREHVTTDMLFLDNIVGECAMCIFFEYGSRFWHTAAHHYLYCGVAGIHGSNIYWMCLFIFIITSHLIVCLIYWGATFKQSLKLHKTSSNLIIFIFILLLCPLTTTPHECMIMCTHPTLSHCCLIPSMQNEAQVATGNKPNWVGLAASEVPQAQPARAAAMAPPPLALATAASPPPPAIVTMQLWE